ncbi:MAG: hypothetical protein IJD06_10105 [Clostridia bacterium]|nr:hypothetical protein [Clostridia bacterium]
MKPLWDKYSLLRTLFAALAVAAGLVYLAAGEGSLAFVLPVMSACFLAVAVIAWRESRAKGATGWIAMLPALAAVLVAVFALIGTAAYFAL